MALSGEGALIVEIVQDILNKTKSINKKFVGHYFKAPKALYLRE